MTNANSIVIGHYASHTSPQTLQLPDGSALIHRLLHQLELSTRYLIGERDALYDSCTNCDGEYSPGEEGENDKAAVAELDQLINDNQAAIEAARISA